MTDTLTPDEEKYLINLYTDTSGSGSFGRVDTLYNLVREEGVHKITKKQIKEFLSGRDEYTLHKPLYHKIKTGHIIIGGINDTHQMDLVDFGKESGKVNDGFIYLLTVIDCFSKMAYVSPLKRKTGEQIVHALNEIYEGKDTPTTIVTDAGKEFTNKTTQDWFKSHDIQFYIAYGTHKAQFIERFNRTLKTLISRYMTLHNTYRYIDVLQNLVTAYNSRYHSSTGYKPIDVNETNDKQIFIKMYGSPSEWFTNLKAPKFKIGDHVRISRLKGPFEKGYEETYTREIYVISRILETDPREYKLKSLNGDDIKGRFYEKELIKVTMHDDQLYQIEKIIKTRIKDGIKQKLVKWKGWDKSHNQWVNESDLVDI